jgi:NAD(P)-dependent dehydrogenase (short-subunit alcohol dehydrogenase family)
MAVQDLTGTTALVTGASRGFGRALARALAETGVQVVAVARDGEALNRLRQEAGERVTPVVADVADPVVAARLIDRYAPRTLVLNAGANPLARPVHLQTWETFSRTWEVDVRQVFNWTREALLRPLEPGSTVIAFSSGAALRGSPLSGGYAGSKATIKFISGYAAEESQRASLGIRFVSVLPMMSLGTDLGAGGAAAYAARQGVDLAVFRERMGTELTPEHVGKSVAELAADPDLRDTAYLLTPSGLNPLN